MYAEGTGVTQDNIYAHMWENIAASKGAKDTTERKDMIEKQMTLATKSKVQKLIHEYVKKQYKGY